MMSHVNLANLASYSAQVAVIVVCGAGTSWLARIDAPGVRYAYWRALAVLCIVLPWLQAYRAAPGGDAFATASASVVSAAGGAQAVAPAGLSGIDWGWPALIVLVIGVLARLTWLAAGLFKLRRLRASSSQAPIYGAHGELQQALGTRASVRVVPSLAQPLTFGVVRPIVLLPESLVRQPADIQRAVLAHELLHVARRDWAWLLAEETFRAVFWFHPGMWWLISRIQLAREEAVDELAVMLTGRRRTYVEALLAFADYTPLAPTAAFGRRKDLYRRMMSVSQEVMMSTRRVVLSCAVMVLVVAGGSWYAVDAFPLQQVSATSTGQGAAGPLERTASQVTPENPVPKRLTAAPVEVPAGAADVSATVAMRLTLDQSGRVAEARATGIRIASPHGSGVFRETTSGLADALDRVESAGTGTPLRTAIDSITRAATDSVGQWRYDPPANAPLSFFVTVSFNPSAARGESQGVSRDPIAEPTSDGALRIGGAIKPPTKIRDVKPVYPADAADARIQGVVIIEVRIEPDGHVSQTQVLRSVPALDAAAVAAVEQWIFVPTLMNGTPVPVIMTVTVNFTLQ